MASLRRAAHKSLIGIQSPEQLAERGAEIRSVANPLKRLGLVGVDNMARHYPRALAAMTGIDRKLLYLEYLDKGHQSIVFRIGQAGDEVLKVLVEDGHPSAKERRHEADQMQHEHEVMANYLGRYVLPHRVTIGPNPLEPESTAIQIRQPYREVDYLLLADNNVRIPELGSGLQATSGVYPAAISEIGDALERSRRLFAERGLSTDLIGRNNSGMDVHTGSYIIIDGQPVTDRNPSVQAAMVGHFDRLDLALQVAAA